MSNFFTKADTAVWVAMTPRGTGESQNMPQDPQDSAYHKFDGFLSSLFSKDEGASRESPCLLGRESLNEETKVKAARVGATPRSKLVSAFAVEARAQAEAEVNASARRQNAQEGTSSEDISLQTPRHHDDITLQPKQMAWLGGVSCLASPSALMVAAVVLL